VRVVVDTNVFVSSFFGGNTRKIIDLWKDGKLTLCLSDAILEEYTEVLRRMGLDDDLLGELLTLFGKGINILFTTKTPEIKAVKSDPDDDKFIECAVALKADSIVTGDKALAALRKYKDITILTPQAFLKQYKF
jgi:putative PIN family toxin of toxin-antitoxin system